MWCDAFNSLSHTTCKRSPNTSACIHRVLTDQREITPFQENGGTYYLMQQAVGEQATRQEELLLGQLVFSNMCSFQ